MKIKRVLKFYFGADSLERAFDNLILKKALLLDGDTLGCAERICILIGEKNELSVLWRYLDGIISGFSEAERDVLKEYAQRRGGGDKLAFRRAVTRFTRRAHRVHSFERALRLVGKYYCLLAPS